MRPLRRSGEAGRKSFKCPVEPLARNQWLVRLTMLAFGVVAVMPLGTEETGKLRFRDGGAPGYHFCATAGAILPIEGC